MNEYWIRPTRAKPQKLLDLGRKTRKEAVVAPNRDQPLTIFGKTTKHLSSTRAAQLILRRWSCIPKNVAMLICNQNDIVAYIMVTVNRLKDRPTCKQSFYEENGRMIISFPFNLRPKTIFRSQ